MLTLTEQIERFSIYGDVSFRTGTIDVNTTVHRPRRTAVERGAAYGRPPACSLGDLAPDQPAWSSKISNNPKPIRTGWSEVGAAVAFISRGAQPCLDPSCFGGWVQ
jgi:hypothetical protein